MSAVTYCASSSWGYAGNVTGGGSATPTLVSNESQLMNALKNSNKVIIITQDITVSGQISTDKSNLTIMALPGVKLVNNTQTKDGSGILYLKGSNIILRNLTFEGPGAYDCDGKDNLTLNGAKNVWVDHCDFQDGIDGNFDINGLADNISVTWCRFRYLKAPKSGGSGGAADHRFSNLVGSGSSDKPSDGTYNITFAYCWWDNGCKQRMTRCRNASQHFLNCYWNSNVADYYIGPENADCYIEGCTIEGKPAKDHIFYQNYGGKNGVKFIDCTSAKGVPSNVTDRTVLTPTYSYTALSAADAKTAVTNSSCGAGATLTVTNTGEVSSTCDTPGPGPGPEPQPSDDPDTIRTSTWWNISDADFNSLGTISAPTAVRQLHIKADGTNTVVVDANSKTLGDLSFTHRLKLGGTGSKDYRSLWMDVQGDCALELYMMSSNNSDVRTLNIATGSFDNVKQTLEAGTAISVKSYEYNGPATRIFLYSAGGGINFYGIRLTYEPTPSESIITVDTKNAAHKVLRQGNVYIVRDGKTYNVLGTRVE